MLPVVAEFFGTFALLFAILTTGHWAVVGATLAAAVFLIGDVSGGHMNPAVSIVSFIKGNIEGTKMLTYIAAQIAGAVAAFYAWKVASNGKKMPGF